MSEGLQARDNKHRERLRLQSSRPLRSHIPVSVTHSQSLRFRSLSAVSSVRTAMESSVRPSVLQRARLFKLQERLQGYGAG